MRIILFPGELLAAHLFLRSTASRDGGGFPDGDMADAGGVGGAGGATGAHRKTRKIRAKSQFADGFSTAAPLPITECVHDPVADGELQARIVRLAASQSRYFSA
jgi:hypothetical protein